MLCGKRILDTVNEKLFERAYVRTAVHFRPMYKMRRLSTLERPVNLRRTHGKVSGNLYERRSIRTVSAKLEYNNDILGLERHADIIRSLFANSE